MLLGPDRQPADDCASLRRSGIERSSALTSVAHPATYSPTGSYLIKLSLGKMRLRTVVYA